MLRLAVALAVLATLVVRLLVRLLAVLLTTLARLAVLLTAVLLATVLTTLLVRLLVRLLALLTRLLLVCLLRSLIADVGHRAGGFVPAASVVAHVCSLPWTSFCSEVSGWPRRSGTSRVALASLPNHLAGLPCETAPTFERGSPPPY